jgi:alkanesulfonate monooxygenase SsuD/methylene tetrahydromethanopterin reductase-like flavin-dependent oxidoreductase (luciferase family)
MIGSRGPRMLEISLPHVDSWNVWFSDTDNTPAGVPALRQLVDDACRAVGREPSEVERTVAVQVRMPGGQGRIDGSGHASRIRPLEGSPGDIADELRAYADEGIAHVQLVVDPIDRSAIEALAPTLAALERA